MEYTTLGNTSLKISKLCLGCMGFGDPTTGQHSWTLPYEQSKVIIKRALDLGVNFFDTALVYQMGSSERYVGQILRENAKRDEVVVATKFVPRSRAQVEGGQTAARHIEESLDASLEHLGMDYVDLYICHMWDYTAPIYEIMEALHREVKRGRVRYIGISNCFAYQLARANDLAEHEGLTKFVSLQSHFNLIFREEEREMMQLCAEDNIAMTPYSPLAGGRLCRLPTDEATKRLVEDTYAKGKYDGKAQDDLKIILRVHEIAQKYGVSMTEVSLAYAMLKTAAPVAGATKLSQLEGAVKACDLKLQPEDVAYLEELYTPHPLVGVMAQNTLASSKQDQVWVTANQK